MITQTIQRTLSPNRGSLSGFPFAAVALLPLLWVGQDRALCGLFVAIMATFTLCMPLIAVLAGVRSPDADIPLTAKHYTALVGCWIAADLAGVLIAGCS